MGGSTGYLRQCGSSSAGIRSEIFDEKVRQAVAKNTRTLPTGLAKLVSHRDTTVRQIAIENYLDRYPQGLPLVLKTYTKSFPPNFTRFIVFIHLSNARSSFEKKFSFFSNWFFARRNRKRALVR